MHFDRFSIYKKYGDAMFKNATLKLYSRNDKAATASEGGKETAA